MLEQLLTELRNWFRVQDSVDGKHPGTYTVESGGIVLPFLQNGQYFRIIGSVFNDGLYIYGETIMDEDRNEIALTDETFKGSIWALAVPRTVIQTAAEMGEVTAQISKITGQIIENPFTSESFGGYSYSKDQSGQLAALTAQRNETIKRLNQWRRIRED